MIRLLSLSAFAVLALSACTDTGVRKFGTSRKARPEIQATSPPPLSAPPSMREKPGRPGSAVDDPALATEASASGDTGSVSAGQSAIIGAAGPSAPPNIRQRVEQDQQVRSQRADFTDDLIARPSGPSSDASVPLIQPGSKSWLGSIF